METIRLTTTIGEDGRVHIDAPSTLPPGPAEVVLVVHPAVPQVQRKLSWRALRGLGKEIWHDIDGQEYVNRLRDEWER
jgi:hypothetical protein